MPKRDRLHAKFIGMDSKYVQPGSVVGLVQRENARRAARRVVDSGEFYYVRRISTRGYWSLEALHPMHRCIYVKPLLSVPQRGWFSRRQRFVFERWIRRREPQAMMVATGTGSRTPLMFRDATEAYGWTQEHVPDPWSRAARRIQVWWRTHRTRFGGRLTS